MRTALHAAAALASLVLAGPAAAQYPPPSPPPPSVPPPPSDGEKVTNVNAEGNPFAGGMRFNPASVTTPVGGVVRWTNTDCCVPHTATENHGLWDLSGSYGEPAPFTGFGPGEKRDRTFEAGTHRYYCKVHPEEMKGTVAVPVKLRKVVRYSTKRHRTRLVRIQARWATRSAGEGLVFDVQRRSGSGPWRALRSGTRGRTATFAGGRSGTVWRVRARLRRASDRAAATDWSPPARIRR